MDIAVSYSEQKTVRKSSLELLRIFCILAIIGDHFVGQSGITTGGGGGLLETAFYDVCTSLSRVACNVFVIISAWFLSEQPFRMKRVLHVWLTVIGFTVPILFYLYRIGEVGDEFLLLGLFPVEESALWFVGYYIVLVIFSPLFNRIIIQSKRQVQYLLLIFLLLLVIYPTVTGKVGFFFHDIFSMIFVYFLTGYIKKYVKIPNRRTAMVVFVSFWFVLTALRVTTKLIPGDFSAEWGAYFEFYRSGLQTLPNLIMAFSLFFTFYGIDIGSRKLINFLAGSTLGVYCFHQVPGWYNWLWTNVFHAPEYATELLGFKRGIYVICSILTVWMMGTVLELIRAKISEVVIEKRGWYKDICDNVDKAVNGLHDEGEPFGSSVSRSGIIKLVTLFTAFCLLVTVVTKTGAVRILQIGELNTDTAISQEEIKLSLDSQLEFHEDGELIGRIQVKNSGKSILHLSSGVYPVNLGISIVDSYDNVINLDYTHLPITEKRLGAGETLSVPIHIENADELLTEGNGIRFCLVQEAVNWLPETAIYFRI